MKTKKYIINIIGCDDTTKINVELTEKEIDVVRKIAVLSHENSSYQCQPTINIES